jgi:hypothetical protein
LGDAVLDRVLLGFALIWLGGLAALTIVGLAGVASQHGLGAAWRVAQETFSPFNVRAFIVHMAVAAPGIAALWWRARRREKREAGRG